MKKLLFLLLVICTNAALSQDTTKVVAPDTVKVGIYITSVHDVDFRDKEYSVNLWLWLKYKRSEFDFMRNLEVPMAKSFQKSYATIDTLEDGTIYVLMKLECVMKGTWKISYFPFDQQRLRFSIENSMYDSSQLIFTADREGEHYGKWFLTEWEKDSFNIVTENKVYETGFGDPSLSSPRAVYSVYRVTMVVHRDSWQLFFKLFLGMYISFLIACVCFYIHSDNMDSRLALSVGSLFAVVGNKYIIDSALPESNSFTLVDTLHGITLFYIFLVIASSVHTLRMIKKGNGDGAEKFNRIFGNVILAIYIIVNAVLIYTAYNSKVVG
ncbi:MAG TPA: hypothetical protein VK174_09580 [Chitinophagales bacterium]|nr:hypothetical protein [Chitinophagales bacterium]